MRSIARQAKKRLPVVELARSLVRHLPPKDWAGEVEALHRFVRDEVRYVRDVRGVETIAIPEYTVATGQGDCDDKGVLLASLLEAIGHPARFTAIGFKPNAFNHVFVETKIGPQWIALETTEPVEMGWRPGKFASIMYKYI
jgi:transglutaminase-like putative cysteine protease